MNELVNIVLLIIKNKLSSLKNYQFKKVFIKNRQKSEGMIF